MTRKTTPLARSRAASPSSAKSSESARLADRAPMLILALDERGRIVGWNRACRTASGYGLADLAAGAWRKLFPVPRTRRAFLTELAARRDGAFRDWDWEITARSGEQRVWRWTSGDRRSAPWPCHAWAVGRDVTDERAAQRQLRRLEQRLRNVEHTAGLGIWEWDVNSNAVHWSAEVERMFGFRNGQFDGSYATFLSCLHPDDRARYQRQFTATMAAGIPPFEVEFRIVRTDGQVRCIRCKGMAEHDAAGRPVRAVGINIDCTEQKLAESRLHEQNENLNSILQSPDIVIFHQDRALRYTWVANPTLGATRAGSVGRTDDEILGKAEARLLIQAKRRVIRSGRGERLVVRIAAKSRAGWFDLFLEPKRNPSGRIVGVVGAAIDITARKLAEEELAVAHRRSQELAAHLRDSVEQERSAISRDVHDQVGAILTALRLRLASLASKIPNENVSERAELLSIEALTESAMHATRDICSRLRPTSLEDIGLADTFRWYIAEWSRNSGIRAISHLPRTPCRGDPVVSTDLFRILQELLTNVVRHSGGSSVDVALTCGRRQMRLVVKDDGHGFVPGEVTRGFGLQGIRERAQHHGGHVNVATSSQGTAVDVIIPVKAAR